MAQRKNTVADALALRMMNKGFSHFEQPHVSRQLWGLFDHAPVEDACAGKCTIIPNAEGEALLAQSPLWALHQRLLEMGYQRDFGSGIKSRLASKRYIPYYRYNADDKRESAWISASGSKSAIFANGEQLAL